MNRRSLFGALALSPLMAVPAFAKGDTSDESPTENSPNLTLHGVMKKNGEIMRLNSRCIAADFPQYDPNIAVSMSVGQDGNLWLRSKGGDWKRVVTE